MRHTSIWAGLAFFAAALAPAAAADNWTTFTDPTHTFSMTVPQTPAVTNKATPANNGKSVPVVEYMIDRGNYALLAMVSNYEGMTIDREHAVDNAVSGMQGGGRSIVTNAVITVDGHSGREVTLVDASGEQFLDRAFFFGDRLYQAITVVPKTATPDQIKAVKRFAYSLHFLR